MNISTQVYTHTHTLCMFLPSNLLSTYTKLFISWHSLLKILKKLENKTPLDLTDDRTEKNSSCA